MGEYIDGVSKWIHKWMREMKGKSRSEAPDERITMVGHNKSS